MPGAAPRANGSIVMGVLAEQGLGHACTEDVRQPFALGASAAGPCPIRTATPRSAGDKADHDPKACWAAVTARVAPTWAAGGPSTA